MNKNPSPPHTDSLEHNSGTQREPDAGDATRLPLWLQSQLTREYSRVVNESLPADLLDLVLKLEENPGIPQLPPRGPVDE